MQYNITYREKDNSWQYIISYKDNNGKWKQKSKQGFEKSRKGKLQAKEHAEKTIEQLKEKILFDDSLSEENKDITFKQFSNMYIEHEKLYKQANTITTYLKSFAKFKPLANTKMKDITNLDIQLCIDEMLKRELSPNTIITYTSKIITLFNAAVEEYNIILESPAKKLNLPKKQETTKKALTRSELDDLLSKIKNEKYLIMSLLASACGLRIGEIIGLVWADIVGDKIYVINQWKYIEDNGYGFGDLKSKNSKRVVPIPPKILSKLDEYRKSFPSNYSKRIFPYTSTSNAAKLLANYYKKIGYNISIHELRHTYATLLISNGLDFKTTANLMGHDIRQTMATYSHVTSDMLKNAQNIVNKIF